MAVMTAGALVGEVSGSVSGLTVHRGPGVIQAGRKGRRKVGPSTWQRSLRGAFARYRREWLGLSPAHRAAWRAYGGGETEGWGRFYQTRIGESVFSVAPSDAVPVGVPPAALESVGVTCSVGSLNLFISWSPTPTTASVGLWVEAVVFRSPATRLAVGRYRLWTIIDPSTASPVDYYYYWGGTMGMLQVGQSIGLLVKPFDVVRRLFGPPLLCRCVVAA